ncbi:unnamed protein product [Mytilus edulis]|uniref:B box-type domain-containing protein n=1 Tax=Mytilus edulis TaxID=6550 RepID=A0A8S3SED6_MYTED|nr:unnamed protein product [Mytilus edulis]
MSDRTRQDPNAGDILDKVSDYCDYHADEKVIQFCIQHDVLICKKCVRNHHSECESIISINSAIKDAKYGSAFTDIETRIEQLNRKIRNVSTRQTHDYNYLSTKKDKIKNKISTVRKTINDYLDKIERYTKLFMVNIGGEILSETVTTFKIKTICLSNSGTIYWTNLDNNEIHTVQPDGKQELFFSSHELEDPRGLAVDGKCNVYVAGYMSNNIFMISKDKMKVKVILNYKDQIKSPI